MTRLRWLALGGLAMYFFDPQGGRRRRHVLRDRLAAVPRRIRRRSHGRKGTSQRAISASLSEAACKSTR